MPRLRRHVRGQSFYVSGHVPGVGYSTWQIGAEGLGYLASLGITGDGDRVSLHNLRSLLDRQLIWTSREGPGGEGKPSPDPILDRLVSALEDWAGGGGGLRQLAEVVRIGGNNHLDRCFSNTLLDWLAGIAPGGSLLELLGLTEAAFADLAARRYAELDGEPLFGRLAQRGSILVPWRLAAIVGLVARQLRSSRELPEEWQAQPVLSYVFARLIGRDGPSHLPSGARTVSRRSPFITWDVDLQQVVAVLPAQHLAAGTTGLTWQVNGTDPIRPLVGDDPGTLAIQESTSGPLRPSEVYEVRIKFLGDPARVSERWVETLMTGLIPFVLFHPDGTLADLGRPEPLLAGEYLALVPPGAESVVRERCGLVALEQFPLAPICWPKWTGWRVRIEPGVDLEPYLFAEPGHSIAWELESPPEPPVTWLDALPVWLGRMPRVLLSDPCSFIGAVLEVSAESKGELQPSSRELVIGTDIPLSTASGRAAVDLDSATGLSNVYGRIRLTCRPPVLLDEPPLALGFVRLPEIQLRYVPDPDRPTSAIGVRLQAGGPGVVAGPDTRIVVDPDDPGAVMLRPANPESSPAVTACLLDGRGEVRVRVPVTRAALATAADGFLGWRVLPFDELDLSSIGLEDRLILEFHREPPTERGRLVSRIREHAELFVGDRSDGGGRASLFEIDLHRWRDGFGPRANGTLQIRGASGWIDVASLQTMLPQEPSESRPTTRAWWQQWVDELDRSIADGDVAAVEGMVRRCVDHSAWEAQSDAAADLLPVAVARATLATLAGPDAFARARAALAPLVNRPDLPEARIMDLALAFRPGLGTRGDDHWLHDDLERLMAELPDGRDRDLLLAEAYYRYACAASRPSPAYWDSCLELCDRFLRRPGTKHASSIADAVLIREFARLMRYDLQSSVDEPREDVLLSHAPWVQVAWFAIRYVREPRPRPRAYPDLPLLLDRAPTVLRTEDAEYLRAIVDHARGALLDEFRTPRVGVPFAGLLQARAALFAGDWGTARRQYDWLLEQSRTHGPYELLDLIAEERPPG
ncbi:hypothetical protein V5E97_03975 [Singulisphaera sp. Ch08]|uniref:Alpha-2-macroglobulin domain-containing protein n=1 Tax=Singulisphaera sp. Ch08 TaxID=3120278 RepID=A0AAU7CJK1_9BACT